VLFCLKSTSFCKLKRAVRKILFKHRIWNFNRPKQNASSEQNQRTVSILSGNIRSIKNKVDEVKESVLLNNCDINAFTESWTTEEITDNFLDIPSYVSIRRDRVGKVGGGILCYVRDTFNVSVVECENLPNMEVLPFYLQETHHLFVCVYHPFWNNQQKEDELMDLLLQIIQTTACKFKDFCYHMTIIGDFNGCKINNFNEIFQLSNIVDFPTRGNASLDCCFTTNFSQYTCVKLAPLGKSDHCLFKCVPKDNKKSKNYTYKYIPDFKPSNRIKFTNIITQCDFISNINIDDEIELNEQYDTFIQKIISIYDHCFPKRKVKVPRHSLPWVNDGIRHCISKRNYFYRTGNRAKFSHYRIKVKHLLHKARVDYVSKIETLSDKNSWDRVKVLGNLKVNKQEPSSVSINDLLKQFTSIPEPPKSGFTYNLDEASPTKIQISLSEVREKLLKVKKGGGCPYISPWVFKNFADLFSIPFHTILTASLKLCKIPDNMKLGTITPVPKTKTPKLAADFRPITNISPFLKVFEELVIEKWFKPMVKANYQSFADQFAFVPLPGRGCTSALVCAYGKAIYHIDQGKYVNLVLVDLSKAFDRASKVSIIDQLLKMGATQQCAVWTYNFLSDRKIRVRLGNDFSHFVKLNVGTPQGSKLSPVLFAILCSSLQSSSLNCQYIKYADDLTIIHHHKTGDKETLQKEIEHVEEWCHNNHMIINSTKTNIIHFSGRKQPSPPIVSVSNKTIECVPSAKLLGLHIHKTMKWSFHIDQSIKKASRLFYSMLRLKKARCNTKVLLTLYQSLVRPHITYSFAAICNLSQNDMKKLIKAEKRFTYIIGQKCSPDLPTFLEQSLKRLHHQVRECKTHPIRQLLLEIKPTCTRRKNTFIIPKGNSSLYMRSFIRFFL